jgi:hypothetical protein
MGRQIFDSLRSAIVKRLSGPEFTCGDCERSNRCGRPPNVECVAKLEQIERDPVGYRRRRKSRTAFLKSGYWA